MSSLGIGRAALERVTGDLAAAGGVRAVVLDDGRAAVRSTHADIELAPPGDLDAERPDAAHRPNL